ncbi:MAG TPA: 3'-5' exonuclease domain-containing protein 2 [Candidatus Phocaeicola caecigallinarum]|uniref:3'-5' exonuclease n=1 Tax=Bacteroides sp. An19 TaxID=1965580 RepID=UPI000B3AE02E|nr:3'-5' exonuclease [Bacteroides sp. An19]OUP36787.1 3'-5' exonuclease [Bacteroides sp. An19]HJD09699.1 3'-5' exonuclease domain-containing protein 2 [Candidatus Phocaeicola caecigallinarum]
MIILQNKISKQEVSEMQKVSFSGRIFVIYTETEARKAIDYLNTHSVVGVDTETRPSFRKGMTHKVALLQIATYDTCFLFRLNHLGLPDFLEEFLQNDVLKVGLSLRDDFAVLRKRNGGDLRDGNWIELQDYVPHFGIEEKSLQKIYALLFGKKISKAQRLSNWEAEVLTEAQQLYAATDAWACVEIYSYLEDLRSHGNYRIEKVEEKAGE